MIIVIFIVCIALIALGVWVDKQPWDIDNTVIMGCGVIGATISFIAIVALSINVSQLKVIDEKIEMYEIENAKIEKSISECVEQYQQYESGIFTEINPESAITLVSLYPELKADKLVSAQIDVYIQNNEEIKWLKSKKINGNVVKWWLYFG